MYVEERPSWLRLVFKYHGSVLPRIWVRVLVTTLVATVFTYLQKFSFFHLSLTLTPFSLIGLPLGIFLGFRNGASYDRFWEGRKLWGNLVNQSRSFVRQVLTLVHDDTSTERPQPLQRTLAYRLLAFVYALRAQLRNEPPLASLGPFLSDNEMAGLVDERNVALAILQTMGEQLQHASQRGWIHPFHVPVLEGTLGQFTDILGACERIKTTPLPFSYTILIHRIVAIYCFLLPFGLTDTTHHLTPLVVMFVSYALFGLDAIGDEIENPFGTDKNDLPLTAIARTVEINVRQLLGETDLPAPIEAVRGFLS